MRVMVCSYSYCLSEFVVVMVMVMLEEGACRLLEEGCGGED